MSQNYRIKNEIQDKQGAQMVVVYSKSSGKTAKYERKQVYEKSALIPEFRSRQYQTVKLEPPKQPIWKRPYENHKHDVHNIALLYPGKRDLPDLCHIHHSQSSKLLLTFWRRHSSRRFDTS